MPASANSISIWICAPHGCTMISTPQNPPRSQGFAADRRAPQSGIASRVVSIGPVKKIVITVVRGRARIAEIQDCRAEQNAERSSCNGITGAQRSGALHGHEPDQGDEQMERVACRHDL